ncbi:MAG: acyl-[ACP]--phospholipid O-acyltransferase, partial [Hyphomicrobiales bacterium]|nr:acyl-[ACP]--phospholipid O-acyltransferase [Hyphomicrobiales bacterium]
LLCWGAARFIPATRVGAPGLEIERNIFRSSLQSVRELHGDARLWIGGLAVSWFWVTGAIALSLVPVVVKHRTGGGIDVESAISALFAIGIAIGSIGAALLSHGRILLLPTPVAALAMAGFLIDLGLTTLALSVAGASIGLSDFLATSTGIRIAVDVAGLAASAGLFVVPIFSAVQAWAGEDRRARVIGGVNIVNSLFIVGGALTTAVLQSGAIGLSEPVLLIALGVLNVGACVYFARKLPGNFMADGLTLTFRLFNRLEVHGLEHIAAAGERCVIAANHVSFLDAPAILSVLDRKPVFAIDRLIAERWWVRPFLSIAHCLPVDPSQPLATRALIQQVKAGRPLVIFPEGRITVTGSLMKVYDGAAMIADKAEALIVPARIEGLEESYFSRLTGRQIRRRLFPKVRITFLPPRRLQIDPELKGRKRRHAAGAALQDLMADLLFQTTRTHVTLMEALVHAIKRSAVTSAYIEDPLSGALSARKVLAGAAVLGRKIMAITKPNDCVGLLLPNTNGTIVTFFAVQSAGRTAAMLNYTAGAANLIAACKAANVSKVMTARAFVEKAKLGEVVAQLEQHVELVWLEDVRDSVSGADRLRGLLRGGRPLVARHADDAAVVLFTSGSEGAPKGVVLSHRNLLANVAQIKARFDITGADVVFNALPVFHSFGMTGGMLLPMLTGMRLYLYPSPLHYRLIPELIYGTNATVLFGTDTFLAGYARLANAYDFRSLRYVVAGAEPVKEPTRKAFMEKFGLRILEGYGVTETAPVLAVNTPMFNRIGTVGRLMPGVSHRLEAVPGIDEGGRLHVRGPNIMLGYLRAQAPGVLEETRGGWHDTGDIVTLDAQGFITIKGRAKRFAKIAGEMVSLAAVESAITRLWPDAAHAVVALPDPRKGERLLLVTTQNGAARAEIQAFMRSQGATELMMPGDIWNVVALPLLGSGKTDYAGLNQLVAERQAPETVN